VSKEGWVEISQYSYISHNVTRNFKSYSLLPTPTPLNGKAEKRVSIILGTRPEAIKLAPVIQVFRRSPAFDTQVILTGQHREMVEQVMQLFDLNAAQIWRLCHGAIAN